MTTTTATSSSTSSTSSLASSTSSSSTSSTNKYGQSILTSLSAGSGVDVKSLAQNLVDAEKAPQADAINKKIAKCDARISGYGAISYILDDLRTKFSALNATSGFDAMTVSNSQSAAFTATTDTSATEGSHSVAIAQLAQGQKSISSSGFASTSSTLSADTTLSMSLGGTALTSISVSAGTTAAQLVASINKNWGGSGIQAQLVNKGNAATDPTQPYHLVITGPTGASNTFTMSGLTLDDTPLQSAKNAQLTVDGVSIESTSNTVKEAIPGVSLKLTAPTSGTASLDFTRNIDSIKTKIQDLVTSFNDVGTVLTATTNPDSKVDGYGASLVGDSTVSTIRSQVRELFFNTSSTPGTYIKSVRDLGISVDRNGVMTLDNTKLTSALQNHFDDTVKMFSNNRSTPTTLRSIASGTAGDAVKKITDLLGYTGSLSTQTRNTTSQQTKYKDDLTRLDDRMSKLLTRYNQQFSAMESLVGQINSQKSSLKSTFDGMAAQAKG